MNKVVQGNTTLLAVQSFAEHFLLANTVMYERVNKMAIESQYQSSNYNKYMLYVGISKTKQRFIEGKITVEQMFSRLIDIINQFNEDEQVTRLLNAGLYYKTATYLVNTPSKRGL